jgi:hypothetical protein
MIARSAAIQTPHTSVSFPVVSFPAPADESPWGNVLIHQPDAGEALELQRILRTAGYRTVGPAASQADVERFLDGNAIDCAVIDARAGFELGALLNRRAIPLVAISGDSAGAILWRASGHPLVLRPYTPGEILRAIHLAMRGRSTGGPSAVSA